MPKQKSVIAITGSSGLIGSHLVPVLANEGFEIRVLRRRLQNDSPGFTQIHGDIRSLPALCALMAGCSSVIHLAAIAHTSLRSKAELEEAEQVNVGGTQNVLSAAEVCGLARVLLVSSAHVYALQDGMSVTESSPTAANSVYARTKLRVEQAGLDAANKGRLTVVIVRPCLTYGPGVRFNLELLMRAIRSRYYFHASGRSPIRSFLSVGNAARAIAHLINVGRNGEIYNLADESPMPLVQFVDSLADLMQVPRPVKVPRFLLQGAVACLAPLDRLGYSPLNREALRRLWVSFSLDVNALAASGFRWADDGLVTRQRMVEAFLRSRV